MSAVLTREAALTYADLPPMIGVMVRDEANLSSAKNVLDDARRDAVAREAQVQAKRPALGFLGPKKQREEYAAALASVQAQLATIDALLARVTAARDRLQPGLRIALVEYLSTSDPRYRQGLRAARYHEHWKRAHSVVADRLQGFVRDVRNLRTAIQADVAGGRVRLSSETGWRLSTARETAAELEREIQMLNRIANEHAAAVKDTIFDEIQLPMLEAWPCIQRIDAFVLRSPNEAAVDVENLLADYTELKGPSLETIAGMFRAIADEHAQIAEKCLRERWSELLAYAETHWVCDTELEPTLADIERRQAELERRRLLAQAPNRPFTAER